MPGTAYRNAFMKLEAPNAVVGPARREKDALLLLPTTLVVRRLLVWPDLYT